MPGLRALLRGLVNALAYSRINLSERLEAEAARAQREWQRGEAAQSSCMQLREQLAGRNRWVCRGVRVRVGFEGWFSSMLNAGSAGN